MTDIEKRIKMAASQAVQYRNYRRARDRALTRLAQAYPDEYKEYLQEEKLRDERENKKWIDITGATGTGMDTNANPHDNSIRGYKEYPTYKGNDGGEA